MTVREFLDSSESKKLQTIKKSQFIWEKIENDNRMILYKMETFYLQIRISIAAQRIVQYDCFGRWNK